MYFQSHEKISSIRTICIYVLCLVGGWLVETLGLIIRLAWNFKIMHNNGNKVAYIFLWIGAFISGTLAIICSWIWKKSVKIIENNGGNNNRSNYNNKTNQNEMSRY